MAQGPLNQLRREQQRLDYLWEGLQGSMKHRMASAKDVTHTQRLRLHALSPLAVLDRGYSITRTESGEVIKEATQVKKGDTIVSKLAKGEVRSSVFGVDE
jgi:exodeoxyribonuclease VII large subunit